MLSHTRAQLSLPPPTTRKSTLLLRLKSRGQVNEEIEPTRPLHTFSVISTPFFVFSILGIISRILQPNLSSYVAP